jgi:hypothetical protein
MKAAAAVRQLNITRRFMFLLPTGVKGVLEKPKTKTITPRDARSIAANAMGVV